MVTGKGRLGEMLEESQTVKITFMLLLNMISLQVLVGKSFLLLLLLYDWFSLNGSLMLTSHWIILFYVKKV